MIAVILRNGSRVELPNGAAVVTVALPSVTGQPGDTPATAFQVVTADGRVLAVFRRKETAGYVIEPATA